MRVKSDKSSALHIRIRPKQRNLITRAAEVSTKTLSDFVRDSALKEAEVVLADQTRFELSPDEWDAFIVAIDSPVSDENMGLRDLLSREPVWAK